jgi:hypothetical protein
MQSPLEERFAKAVYLIRNGPKKNSSNDEKLKVYIRHLFMLAGRQCFFLMECTFPAGRIATDNMTSSFASLSRFTACSSRRLREMSQASSRASLRYAAR